jgi:hypothetical protein
MKTTFIKFAATICLFAFLVAGCHKDLEEMEPQAAVENITSMDQLKVPSDFNWKTTQDVELTLTAATRATVVIKSAAGVVYQKALLIPGEQYVSILTLPVYENELTFIFNGKPVVMQITNKKITHSF